MLHTWAHCNNSFYNSLGHQGCGVFSGFEIGNNIVFNFGHLYLHPVDPDSLEIHCCPPS